MSDLMINYLAGVCWEGCQLIRDEVEDLCIGSRLISLKHEELCLMLLFQQMPRTSSRLHDTYLRNVRLAESL
jgi:hypothetical protein